MVEEQPEGRTGTKLDEDEQKRLKMLKDSLEYDNFRMEDVSRGAKYRHVEGRSSQENLYRPSAVEGGRIGPSAVEGGRVGAEGAVPLAQRRKRPSVNAATQTDRLKGVEADHAPLDVVEVKVMPTATAAAREMGDGVDHGRKACEDLRSTCFLYPKSVTGVFFYFEYKSVWKEGG